MTSTLSPGFRDRCDKFGFRSTAILMRRSRRDAKGAAGLVEANEATLGGLSASHFCRNRSGMFSLSSFRIGHHRNGQLEVWRQLGRHGNRQLILTGLQFDEPIVQHLGPLKRDQPKRRLLAQ